MKFKSSTYSLKEVYRKLSVPQFTIVTGLIIIFLGTLIISSPLCSSTKVGLWEAFFTSTSAIPRRMTGLTSKQQRDLTLAVKRARIVALLPFVNPEG